ncbi:MFS transporter [Anabaena sp. FACHB-1237]|uniref:MFS transporter n=1 Tax=Anabaena sp. FACHB-1237 TaxID=2692769 RepID=UPI00168062A2|nr:MFS transporter [Anabaena sp. FACHB-1237]MBD2138412.1 MFS transporter [Anabaena sp. FACHB-1237]
MLQKNRTSLKKSNKIFALLKISPAIIPPNLFGFLIGESVSFFGSWMTQIALVWLVYQLTNSVMLVGIAGFSNQVMGLVITPLVGVLLDRWNLKYVLLTTQIISIFLSSLLTFLTVSNQINFTDIIIIGILQGIVKSFDLPARQVTIPRLLENRSETYSAMAVHSFLINTAKFVSPMIGGLIIARNGVGLCFLVDAISYLPFMLVIFTIRIKPNINNPSKSESTKIWHNLKEGFIFVYNFVPIRSILILQVIVCFMAMTYVNMMPMFAKEVLKGNAETMGFLMTSTAFGSIFSGIYLVRRKKVIGLETVMAISTLVLGVSLILFSRSTRLEFCLVLIFIVGLTNTLTLAAINNFMQLILVEEDKRGRVTSIFMTTFVGILPLGNLFFGGLAHYIGVANALFFGGTCCVFGVYFFARKISNIRKVVKPIYEEMGLLS